MEVRHNYKIKPFGEDAEKGLSSGIMRLPDFCYLRPPSVHSGGLLDSWSSLVEGNERCLGPRGNLLCF